MRLINLLNVGLHNITMVELLEKLRTGGIVFTPNVDHLMKLQRNPEFYSIYQEADYRVCDSKVLIYVSAFLGTPIKEKISGSDLFPAFYNYYQHDESIKIFLLGGDAVVAKNAQEKINYKVGRDIIVAAHSPSYGFEKKEDECQQIVDIINSTGATVLAIGVGAPKQEMWIAKYRKQLKNIKIYLAIGATINFEAGNVHRAPKWMSEVGLEWLYRLLSEPKRLWRRYLLDAIPFLWLIFQQRFRVYKNPWSTLIQHKVSEIQSVTRSLTKM
ncbi:MAG: WecB/TagA/CpsF family glycosyltransferase [Rhizonema sp. NSF051]|nr:WecB/TagA/CpsF family glycosyltransferase [Rhizonema sp. NSF051]